MGEKDARMSACVCSEAVVGSRLVLPVRNRVRLVSCVQIKLHVKATSISQAAPPQTRTPATAVNSQQAPGLCKSTG